MQNTTEREFVEKNDSILEERIKRYHSHKDDDATVYSVFQALADERVILPVNEKGALLSLTAEDRSVIPVFSSLARTDDDQGIQFRGGFLKDYMDALMKTGLDLFVNPFSEEELQFYLPQKSLELLLLPVIRLSSQTEQMQSEGQSQPLTTDTSENEIKEGLQLICKSTGPDSVEIPYYGTNNFKQSKEGLHLENIAKIIKLYKEKNIYFVRELDCEWGTDGAFELLAWHFEDGMMTAYTYRLSPEDGRKLRAEFPDDVSFKETFGHRNAKDFLTHCVERKYFVDYTKYWL